MDSNDTANLAMGPYHTAALVLLVAAGIFVYFFRNYWAPVDTSGLFRASLYFSIPAAAVFIFFAARSAFVPGGLALVLPLAGIFAAGAAGTSYGLMQFLNARLDTGRASAYTVEVEDTRDTCSHGHSRAPCGCYAVVTGWHDGIESFDLPVGRGEMQGIRHGQKLQVFTRPGAFGFEWISGYSTAR